MSSKKTLSARIATIVAILAGIAALITFLCTKPYIPSKQLSFESYVDKVVVLQNKVDSVSLLYKDVPINNVWKINLRAKNTGRNTIVGLASSSDTDNHDIFLDFGPGFKVLNFDVLSNDCRCIIQSGEGIDVGFKKWNPKEEVRIDILVWNTVNTALEPVVNVNDRDLVGVKINQRNVNVNEIIEDTNNLEWLYDVKKVVPRWVLKVGRILALVVCFIMVIAPLWFIWFEIKDRVSFKRWVKEYYDTYREKVESLDLDDKTKENLLKYPAKMPKEISELTKVPIPTDVHPFYETILISLFAAVFLTIPFLLVSLFFLRNL